MRQVTRTQYKSELKLIADCRQGDSEAIAELFGRHYESCLSVARGFLHSFEESQDAVQSAYFSAFRHLDSFRGESSFRTWMTRLVINQCRMVLRKPARRFNWISLDDPNLSVRAVQLAAAVPTPEKFVLSQEISSALADAMARLPEPMREIFTLCAVSAAAGRNLCVSLGRTESPVEYAPSGAGHAVLGECDSEGHPRSGTRTGGRHCSARGRSRVLAIAVAGLGEPRGIARRARAGARIDWDLRSGFVRGGPARSGDRNPNGVGRERPKGTEYDSAPGDAARNNRLCSRNRGVRCHIEDSLEHVVRIERVRSGGVLWRADSAAGDRHACELCAGSPGDQGRSDDCAAL